MHHRLFLFPPSIALAATPQGEVRDSELWLIRDGQPKQLTRDGKSKVLAGTDEKAAAKYPFGSFEQGERKQLNGGWGDVRKRDGTVIKQ